MDLLIEFMRVGGSSIINILLTFHPGCLSPQDSHVYRLIKHWNRVFTTKLHIMYILLHDILNNVYFIE